MFSTVGPAIYINPSDWWATPCTINITPKYAICSSIFSSFCIAWYLYPNTGDSSVSLNTDGVRTHLAQLAGRRHFKRIRGLSLRLLFRVDDGADSGVRRHKSQEPRRNRRNVLRVNRGYAYRESGIVTFAFIINEIGYSIGNLRKSQ